jgi:hypothetical protein
MHELTVYLSYDPAIDKEAMGADYDKHFGTAVSYGTRDASLIKLKPGKKATTFTIRSLRMMERIVIEPLGTAESKWYRAFSYAVQRIELGEALCGVNESIFPRAQATIGIPTLDEDAVDHIMNMSGWESIYEVGAVAYARSRPNLSNEPFAPRLAISLFVVQRADLSHADSQNQT